MAPKPTTTGTDTQIDLSKAVQGLTFALAAYFMPAEGKSHCCRSIMIDCDDALVCARCGNLCSEAD